MKILFIAPPILKDSRDPQSMLTVPPTGYGGVENVMYALINGLIAMGHEVLLLGAPGSRSMYNLHVIREPRNAAEIRKWISLHKNAFDIIHDHSCGLIYSLDPIQEIDGVPYVATHHQTGKTVYCKNTIYLSHAQRNQAEAGNAPIIRIPVIVDDYILSKTKKEYFLYVGRVSKWKGVYEAAALVKALGKHLIIVGPSWELEYYEAIVRDYGDVVSFTGEIAGLKRLDLIAEAKAVFVLSRFSESPWGGFWCEPGSTIVSEACASGTPIISSTNGCLQELVVDSIGIQLSEDEIEKKDISRIDLARFSSQDLREYANTEWGHTKIATTHEDIYQKVIQESYIW